MGEGTTTRRGFLRAGAAGAAGLSFASLARADAAHAARPLSALHAADDYIAVREAVAARSYDVVERGGAFAQFERWRLAAPATTLEHFDGVMQGIEENVDGLTPFRTRTLHERAAVLLGLLNARSGGNVDRRRWLGQQARSYAAVPAQADAPSPQIEFVLSTI